jgi:hypothetical protein
MPWWSREEWIVERRMEESAIKDGGLWVREGWKQKKKKVAENRGMRYKG